MIYCCIENHKLFIFAVYKKKSVSLHQHQSTEKRMVKGEKRDVRAVAKTALRFTFEVG